MPGASSFVWSRTGERRWGMDQPHITGVINSAGGSLWSFADATPRDADRWQVIAAATPASKQAVGFGRFDQRPVEQRVALLPARLRFEDIRFVEIDELHNVNWRTIRLLAHLLS